VVSTWHKWRSEREFPRLLELVPRGIRRDGVVLAQHVREGRFQRSLALIAAFSSVLSGLEVAYQHYRGSYGNKLMYTPVALTPPLVLAGAAAAVSRRAARVALPVISLLTVADGLVGFGYHVRGIARKPGGWHIPVYNIVMGPPLFAPLLFAVSGYLGLVATFLRREDDPHGRLLPRFGRPSSVWREYLPARFSRRGVSLRQEIREGRFQRHMAGACAAASLFSGVEALYSHYKSNFKYRMQWTPVVIAPMLTCAAGAAVGSRAAAHRALPVASLLAIADGGIGTFYHARGVLRRPGGAKHLLYNIMYGAPLFAPLLLSAAGFLGLLASLMRRERS
jgi:hypothetical protein